MTTALWSIILALFPYFPQAFIPGPGIRGYGGGAYQVGSNARQFSGSGQYLQSSTTVDLSSTKVISLHFFMWWDAFADDDSLMGETSDNYNNNPDAILLDPNASWNSKWNAVVSTTGGLLFCEFTRPSAAAWHSYLIILDMTSTTNTCTVYVDGSNVSATPTSGGASDNFGNYTLNLFSRNGASLFGAGRLSEVAIWKSTLSSGNATSLAAYTAASDIDAANLLYYWPIKGTSPEVPDVGTGNLNVTGATAVAGPNP